MIDQALVYNVWDPFEYAPVLPPRACSRTEIAASSPFAASSPSNLRLLCALDDAAAAPAAPGLLRITRFEPSLLTTLLSCFARFELGAFSPSCDARLFRGAFLKSSARPPDDNRSVAPSATTEVSMLEHSLSP